MKTSTETLAALLHGPDKPGLVARVAGWIHERGGNIIHADQHRDAEEKIFFQRVEWAPPDGEVESQLAAFNALAGELGMKVRVARSTERPKIALFVSRAAHCFHDLILRWKAGEFRAEVVCVVSNHDSLRSATEGYGLPYCHIPVPQESPLRAGAEEKQLEILKKYDVELVVLARYMQILSARMLEKMDCPAINIHHSFLPAFAGAKPYRQAYRHGVKIIGVTAHYVSAELDAGPIIQQDVTHVTHRHGVEDLMRKGRDLEKAALAQAVRWHLENRVLVYNNKTVVFD